MKFTYLALLAGCVVITLPLELAFRARVYARPRRLLLTVLPVFVAFVGWDESAVWRGQWSFDRRQTIGPWLPVGLPIEELLFFVVVPVCAVLTFEVVHRVSGRNRHR